MIPFDFRPPPPPPPPPPPKPQPAKPAPAAAPAQPSSPTPSPSPSVTAATSPAQPPPLEQSRSGERALQLRQLGAPDAPVYSPTPTAPPATNLLTEDTRDGSRNCLDAAGDWLELASPQIRARSEVLVLRDTRPGAEGDAGHVVIRQGESIFDPSSGQSYPSFQAYNAEGQYQIAQVVGGTAMHRILSTPPGSPERQQALDAARIPPGVQGMLLADGPGVTEVDAASFNPQDPAQVQALAQQYAPIRYLHPDEEYNPGDPQDFIHDSRVREHRSPDFNPLNGSFNPLGTDRTPDGLDEGEIDPAELRDLDGGNLYLDLKDTDAARQGDTVGSPSLYQYDPESNTMTYWYFYPYNDAPGPGDFNHEGDWERVTIQFDDQMNPTTVRYSAHEGSISLPWADAPKEDGRPVVYVAKGSHANSPVPGTTTALSVDVPVMTSVPAPGPAGIPVTVTTVTTVPVTVAEDQFGRGERVDGACLELRDVTAEPWYGTNVHWGERGKMAIVGQEFTSGPKGPSSDKGPLLE